MCNLHKLAGGGYTEYVTCLEAVTKKAKHSYLCKRSELFPAVEVRFEDMIVPVHKNYDDVFKKLYGEDYMKMPPMNMRWNMDPTALDFGDGKGNVIKTKEREN